ncbi:MAG: hypothetical protein WAW88_05460 [Nocardioides sp.]
MSRPFRVCLKLLPTFAAVVLVVGCGVPYGANFDYPEAPPTPGFGSVVAHADGIDDDDPMRGREILIDIGTAKPEELVAFYRARFPDDAGWKQGTDDPDVGGGEILCLVNHSDSRYDEYLEIFKYVSGSRSGGPGRYIVSLSRLHADSESGKRTVSRCGLASIWFPSNL